MAGESSLGLSKVPETLLLPLWGRAVETRKKKPMIVDETAVRVVETIDYDFSLIERNMNELSRLAWIHRSLYFDAAIRDFMARHPGGCVVSVGCGLDTTFDRIDDGRLRWFDLDLPEVIELRRRYIGESDRRTFIAASVFDETWKDRLPRSAALMFHIAGVLYYFTEEQVRDLFVGWIDSFPGYEAVFDYASKLGLRVANKRVIEAGGMDEGAFLKWGTDEPVSIALWDPRLEIVENCPMFARNRSGMGLGRRVATRLSDALRIMSLMRIRARGSSI
jgi:O-methyltransferase involved in polyketide biosynthesis